MVDLQSCESLMKASALCAIEKEVEGESTNHADTVNILAELNTEKQKNTELRERILILEAQIDDRDHTDGLRVNEQGSCLTAGERIVKIFKRQKIDGQSSDKIDNEEKPTNSEIAGPVPIKHPSLKNCLVNWMSKDNTQCFIERSHEDESIDNRADTDETNDTDDQIENTAVADNEPDELLEGEATYHHMKQEPSDYQTRIRLLSDRKAKKSSEGYQVTSRISTSSQDLGRSSNTVIQRRPQKVAFCPKEVRRIIDLELLQHKNAQSHTIRKIVVFASLGIRHGCEDMYELDFNHFSILRKGEPFVSMENPGEHVLYENPGVRKKVFYPNQQIPVLCPVNILEEEKAMRPLDAGCPSCLFLCIKYGGRTRNLPQNEYVRQRMGRNKLKSFGPLICRMATLVHNRDGSFFFKALGITLLFMAGFPDDLVQNETKYRNLDLLQKYYRRDEDAEGEELFLTRPIACDSQDANPSTEHMTEKTSFRKSKGKKKYTSSTIKSHNSEKSIILRSTRLSSAPPAKHTSKDYTSIPPHSIMYQTMPLQSPANTPLTSNPVIQNFGPNIFYQNQSSYPLIPPFPSTSFVPMMYWPPTTTFPPCYFPSSYPQLYYNNALCNTLTPRFAEGKRRKNAASSVSDHSDCNSSSSRKSRREK